MWELNCIYYVMETPQFQNSVFLTLVEYQKGKNTVTGVAVVNRTRSDVLVGRPVGQSSLTAEQRRQ